MVTFRIKGSSDANERLVKRLNDRGNVLCTSCLFKSKTIVRYVLGSCDTTDEDTLNDWAEIQKVATDILCETNDP